jgi:hypothetical protein
VDAFYHIVQDAELVAVAANDLRRPVMASTISKWSWLTMTNIVRAAEDEVQGSGYSNIQFHRIVNRAIALLKTRQGNVFSITRLRDMMWGRIIVWSLPSILLCITISVDNNHTLDAIMGPEAAREFLNSNSESGLTDSSKFNPFLLARILGICGQGLVEDLLGFKRLGGNTGVFGKVRGYLASVTSKGEGKVTMNLVVWLMRSPTLPQMKEALESVKFRERVQRYIDTVARGEPSTMEEGRDRERDELQQHDCSSYCLRYKCADRRATHNATTVHYNGAWELARSTSGYNTYSPSISRALGVRQHLHFFTNGPATTQDISHLGGYLSAHAISSGDTSATMSAVLGDVCRNYLVPGWLDQYSHGIRLLGAVMIAITRQNEIHTEMKVISLMGSNDYLSSHPSKTINWHMLEKTLMFSYDELQI